MQIRLILVLISLTGISIYDTASATIVHFDDEVSGGKSIETAAGRPKRDSSETSPNHLGNLAEILTKRLVENQNHIQTARGIIDKLKGKECKFYGQECNAAKLNFCCGDLKCLRNKWYSPSGVCRFDWEK